MTGYVWLLLIPVATLMVPLLWNRPHRAVVFVLLVMITTPYWLGTTVGGLQVPLIVIAVVLATVVSCPNGFGPLCPADKVLIVGASAVLVGISAGQIGLKTVAVLFGQLGPAYVAGRMIGRYVAATTLATTISYFGIALGCLSIAELAADWHPFQSWAPGSTSYVTWASIQDRAGLPRSEWSFGHSIALGNVLAMCLPFVFASRLSEKVRTLAIILILGGCLSTLSRNAIGAAGITLALSVLFSTREWRASTRLTAGRIYWLGILGALALFAYAQISSAGGAETASSSHFRLHMIDLLSDIRFLGDSGTSFLGADGTLAYRSDAYARGFTPTVDNTFVLLGLQSGWIVAVSALLVIALVALKQIRRCTRSPAGIAVLGQALTLMTVAMITQYATFFWLMLGCAASIAWVPHPEKTPEGVNSID